MTRVKNNKHLAGVRSQERTFLPVVFSSLGGLGPPESVHYLDSFFSEAYAAERAATGSTRRTSHQRTLFNFMQSLLATVASSPADLASTLTHGAVAAPAAAPATDPADPAQGPQGP